MDLMSQMSQNVMECDEMITRCHGISQSFLLSAFFSGLWPFRDISVTSPLYIKNKYVYMRACVGAQKRERERTDLAKNNIIQNSGESKTTADTHAVDKELGRMGGGGLSVLPEGQKPRVSMSHIFCRPGVQKVTKKNGN